MESVENAAIAIYFPIITISYNSRRRYQRCAIALIACGSAQELCHYDTQLQSHDRFVTKT
jgi:hypothetical protein